MKLFYGTTENNFLPLFGKGKSDNDFGAGLYTVKNEDEATEYAADVINPNFKGFTYELKLDPQGLNILDLTNYPIEVWLAAIYQNRAFDGLTEVIHQRMLDFIVKFGFLDLPNFDVIIGYRADNINYKIAKDFLNVSITKEVLDKNIKRTSRQIVIKSKRAFEQLRVIRKKRIMSHIDPMEQVYADFTERQRYFDIQEEPSNTLKTIIDLLR